MSTSEDDEAPEREDRGDRLMEWGADVAEAFENRFLPGGRAQRQVVGPRKVALRGLCHATGLAAFFAPVLVALCDRIVESCGQAWGECGMKALSFEGYDLKDNRVIDYGNRQYRAILHMWCRFEPSILQALERASSSFGALCPHSKDTMAVLDRQGDIVEIMMALCRACDPFGLRRFHTIAEWRMAYRKLIELSRSVDFLYRHAVGGALKLSPWKTETAISLSPPNHTWGDIVGSFTHALAVVAMCVGARL